MIAELVRYYEQLPNLTFVYLGAGHDSVERVPALRFTFGIPPLGRRS